MRWVRILVMLGVLGLGAGTAALAAGAGGDPSSTPAVELHLDTLQNTTVSPDGTTPMGTTPDSSGNGLNATASGTPISGGRFQGALNMSYDDNGVTVPDNTLLRPDSGVTVMAWVRDGNPGDNRLVMGKAFADGCERLSYGLITGPNGGLEFDTTTYEDGDVEQATNEADPSTLWDGHWHAVAGTYDGDTMKLWIDGVLKETTVVGNQPLVYNTDDPSHTGLYAGLATAPAGCTYFSDNPSVPSYAYTGDIDEMRVYDRALTQSEIQTLQASSATSPPELPPSTSTTSSSSSSTTPSSSTSTPPPPPPPVAHVTQSPSPNGHGLLFNAGASTGYTQLLWDLNGDGHTDFTSNRSLPLLNLTSPGKNLQTISVTAVNGSGVKSSPATVHVTVPGLGIQPRYGSQTAVFTSNLGLFTQAIASRGAPTPPCASASVVWGLMDARGTCMFQIASANDIPAPERAAASKYVTASQVSAILVPRVLASVCGSHFIKNCTPYQNIPVYGSYSPVRLNGMTITPARGAAVIVCPQQDRVLSSNATVKLGPFTIKQGSIDLDFTNLHQKTGEAFGQNGSTGPLLTFDSQKDLPDIGGFPVNTNAQLAFTSENGVRQSTVTLHVDLPPGLEAFGDDAQPSADVTVSGSNDRDFHIDTFDISFPHVDLGGIEFDDVLFHYVDQGDAGAGCSSQYFHATGNVFFGENSDDDPATGFKLTPPPSQNGIAFCNGSFKAAGGDVQFSDEDAPEVFPGVFLNNINFAVALNPTLIRGGASLSAADITKISGTLLAVFAHPWEPYTLTAEDAGQELQDLAGRTFTSTSFAIGGTMAIHVPGVGDLNIFHGGAVYEYPDYIGVGAAVHVPLGIFDFNGHIGGQFVVDRGLFELDADAHICVQGFDLACAGGLLVASEKGAVACLQVGPLNPGVGVMFNGHVDVWIPDGCKPSHYWSAGRGLFQAGRAAATAQAPLTFTVAKGEHDKSLKVVGAGGAPHVVVRGPGGQSLTLAGDGAHWSGALEGLSASKYSTTWLGVKNGRPGRYTITPLAGSVPISSFAETRPGYDTDFAAHVTGHGSPLVLHYDARKRGGGQKVTFFEDGRSVMHPIVTSTGGKGTVRFRPAPGAGERRTIVARATIDGSPIRSQTLAHFRYTGIKRTGRPSRVIVRRRGSALIVSWTKAAGSVRYGVVVTRTGGSRQRYTLSGSKRSLRIGHFPATEGAQAMVSARGVLGDWGPTRKSNSVKALRPPASLFLSPVKHQKPAKKKKPKPKQHG